VNELLAIMGPTGTGKTALAIAIAELVDGEIVSCDSAAVFRTLDIGTAKPTPEERAKIPHHLIDVIDPEEQWSAAQFAAAADAAIADIRARDRTPILCGGTGLWMRALVRGIFEAPEIDPEIREQVRREISEKGAPAMHAELERVDPVAASRIVPNDPQRIGRALEIHRQTGTPISKFQDAHGFREQRYRLVGVMIAWPKEELTERLAERARSMYRRGIVEETRACLDRGVPEDAPGLSIIGYRDVVRHLSGEISLAEAIEATALATRQFAKRQRNWFRGEPDVHPVPRDADPRDVLDLMRKRS
jgi:tRNA dimethylallyltransferase